MRMRSLLFLPYYIHWHYRRAVKGIADLTFNFIWFWWHFFSIGLMLKTLFSPWQRLHETKHKTLDLEEISSVFLINTVMRLVGFVVRATFVIIGLVLIILTALVGVCVLVMWLVLPITIIFFLVLGVVLLFK